MRAKLANQARGYPSTIGLAVLLNLTGPTTRPELRFEPERLIDHPFARECLSGVTFARAAQWVDH